MPLPMVHLAVAKNLTDSEYTEEIKQFYLGALSPDAIHMRKYHTRTDKSVTHLNYKLNEVQSFMSDHMNTKNKYFYLGYVIHILTDIFWLETLYRTYQKRLDNVAYSKEERNKAYYNDMNLIDLNLYKKSMWQKSMWNSLLNFEGISANYFVTAKETEDWKNKVLSSYDIIESKYEYPIRFIKLEEMEEFIKETSGRVKNYLTTLSIALP